MYKSHVQTYLLVFILFLSLVSIFRLKILQEEQSSHETTGQRVFYIILLPNDIHWRVPRDIPWQPRLLKKTSVAHTSTKMCPPPSCVSVPSLNKSTWTCLATFLLHIRMFFRIPKVIDSWTHLYVKCAFNHWSTIQAEFTQNIQCKQICIWYTFMKYELLNFNWIRTWLTSASKKGATIPPTLEENDDTPSPRFLI